MHFRTISFVLSFALAMNAHADVIAGGSAGLRGKIVSSYDCENVSFPDVADTGFFKVACLAAVATSRLMGLASGPTVQNEKLVEWLNKNDLKSWIVINFSGIAPEQLGLVTEWTTYLIQDAVAGDSNGGSDSLGSAYIYYKPYPTLSHKCLAEGFDRFHGSVQFLFDFDSQSGLWFTRQIESFVVCRRT